MRRWVILALMTLATGYGCSGNGKEKLDHGGPTPDLFGPDILATEDGGLPTCGTGIYPCGPYGTNQGDVAANLEFVGFADPQEHCKAHADKVMDLGTKARIAFKDWHLGDPAASCAAFKRQLLWVMVSAGWCTPCINEVKQTQAQYIAGAVDGRVGVLNIVFETRTRGTPADETFLKQWIGDLKVTFPAAMDPTFRMGTFFNAEATPFNMLVDTSTMKVFYRQTGGDLANIGQQISAFFQGK